VKYAGANDTASDGKSWYQCPTCKQDYTGELQLGLARARWELVRGRVAEDGERREAADDLARALQDAGEFDGALPLYEEVLAVERRINGDDHPNTLTSISNLANLHSGMGTHDLALLLHTVALATRRRLLGDAHPDTLTSCSNLANLHSAMGNHDLALPLCEEALAGRRRVARGSGGSGGARSWVPMGLCGVARVGMEVSVWG
jgi:tetratricopeptide (TPR) repeat protein